MICHSFMLRHYFADPSLLSLWSSCWTPTLYAGKLVHDPSLLSLWSSGFTPLPFGRAVELLLFLLVNYFLIPHSSPFGRAVSLLLCYAPDLLLFLILTYSCFWSWTTEGTSPLLLLLTWLEGTSQAIKLATELHFQLLDLLLPCKNWLLALL